MKARAWVVLPSPRPSYADAHWWWTRKVRAKTITHLLTDEQPADYRDWFDNAKQLRDLIAELEALSLGS
jgi:hypothetical protein